VIKLELHGDWYFFLFCKMMTSHENQVFAAAISLVPVLVEKWSKRRHTLKNTTRVEITITIGTAIVIENYKKLCSYIRAIFSINCYCYFNPCGILRVWRHLLHFSTKTGTRKINGGRKFSEMKVQKTWLLMFVLDWNLARSFGKSYCALKCKKMDIDNLISVALWTMEKEYNHFQSSSLHGQNYFSISVLCPDMCYCWRLYIERVARYYVVIGEIVFTLFYFPRIVWGAYCWFTCDVIFSKLKLPFLLKF